MIKKSLTDGNQSGRVGTFDRNGLCSKPLSKETKAIKRLGLNINIILTTCQHFGRKKPQNASGILS
jgi:hypothetical protein